LRLPVVNISFYNRHAIRLFVFMNSVAHFQSK
jgi:hypothetical protein